MKAAGAVIPQSETGDVVEVAAEKKKRKNQIGTKKIAREVAVETVGVERMKEVEIEAAEKGAVGTGAVMMEIKNVNGTENENKINGIDEVVRGVKQSLVAVAENGAESIALNVRVNVIETL